MHHLDAYKTHGKEAGWELHKNITECFEQILAICLPSHKLPKQDEQDMQGMEK